jgi:hypothetical protein
MNKVKLPHKSKNRNIVLPLFIICSFISTTNFAQDTFAYASTAKKSPTEIPGKTVPMFEFQAHSRDYEIDQITSDIAGDHFLGETIAKKRYLFDSKYTTQEVIVPGNPLTKTVIMKPVIYDAVQRIEKYLKRQLKKHEISTDSATAIMNKVLDIAINIRVVDTEKFETSLESIKNNDARIDLFINRVQLIY